MKGPSQVVTGSCEIRAMGTTTLLPRHLDISLPRLHVRAKDEVDHHLSEHIPNLHQEA